MTYCSRWLNAILAKGVSSEDSYKMVECSSVLRSKARKDPSAPTETNISDDWGSQDLIFHLNSLFVHDRWDLQIINRSIMSDKLCFCLRCRNVPKGSGSVDGAGDN